MGAVGQYIFRGYRSRSIAPIGDNPARLNAGNETVTEIGINFEEDAIRDMYRCYTLV
jgi:hypothetical protein